MTDRTPWRRRALLGTTAGAVTGLTLGVGLSLAGTPTAAAAPLPRFGDCAELLRWYVDRTLPLVGPYGIGGGPIYAMEDSMGSGVADSGSDASGTVATPVAPTQARTGAEDGQTASGTGTNVQEVGVDEPDLAKTDGELVVRVVGDQLRVSRVGDGVTGEVTDVGAVALPEDLRASELLLSGDRVLVLGASYSPGMPGPVVSVLPAPLEGDAGGGVGGDPGSVDPLPPSADEPVPMPELPQPVPEPPAARIFPAPPYGVTDSSRVVEVDLEDPASPRVLSDRTYGGSLVSARQYSTDGRDVVRLVLHTGMPTLDFVQPDRNRSEREATEANKQVVRDSELSDWLPQVRDTDQRAADATPLLDCREVRHPLASDLPEDRRGPADGISIMGWPQPDLGTLSIVTLPFTDPTRTTATAVTTSAQTVYSSTDRLYLALGAPGNRTRVHAFALDGEDTRYAASGEVSGMVRDRWAMDEQDGVLRLAVGHGGWSAADNGVVTLREDGDELRELGSVRGLGPEEEIKSVRWFDDLAVVVTFRQTDPLYTVDLSDPARPRTLGALKIPGFSTYLHPLGGDRLLGVGQDANRDGQVLGSQVSTFDLSDLRDPRRLDRMPVDGKALVAEHDPRAMTWLPSGGGAGTVLAGTTSEVDGRLGMVELRVGADGSLTRGRTWSLSSWDHGTAAPRALPLGDGRVALVGDRVSVVDVG